MCVGGGGGGEAWKLPPDGLYGYMGVCCVVRGGATSGDGQGAGCRSMGTAQKGWLGIGGWGSDWGGVGIGGWGVGVGGLCACLTDRYVRHTRTWWPTKGASPQATNGYLPQPMAHRKTHDGPHTILHLGTDGDGVSLKHRSSWRLEQQKA